MTQQLNIFGLADHVGEHTKEVREICERFPAATENPGMFAFMVLKGRYPWVSQLGEQQQHDLKEFARDWQSLNRRRQELRENIPR